MGNREVAEVGAVKEKIDFKRVVSSKNTTWLI